MIQFAPLSSIDAGDLLALNDSIDGGLPGWRRIEPDGEAASISLVRYPLHRDAAVEFLDLLLEAAFGRLGRPYVLVELPPSRSRVAGLLRLRFGPIGDRTIEGEEFVVYRPDAHGYA